MSTLHEENLLSKFRKLNDQGQKELLDLAALLLQKQGLSANENGEGLNGQCPLHDKEKHPEAAAEPIFTE
jgi:hypothetical protein